MSIETAHFGLDDLSLSLKFVLFFSICGDLGFPYGWLRGGPDREIWPASSSGKNCAYRLMINVWLEICCVFAEQNMRQRILLVFPKRISEHQNLFINDKYCSPCSCLTLDSWSTRTILWSRGTRWTRWQTSILTSLLQTFHIQGGTFPRKIQLSLTQPAW